MFWRGEAVRSGFADRAIWRDQERFAATDGLAPADDTHMLRRS